MLDSIVVESNVEVVYVLSSAKITYCCISLYFSCDNHLKQFYISNKTEHFSYKGGCGVMHIKVFNIRAVFGYILTALVISNINVVSEGYSHQ